MATVKKAPESPLTERAKLAARTKVFAKVKGELRKGWDAVDDEVVQTLQASDEACIASYKQQLLAGAL